MADPYFIDRPTPSGYKPTRISNNFHLENIAVSGNSHGGLLQTPPRPRFFSTPSIHSRQFYPFIQQQQPPALLPPPPSPTLRPHRSLPSQPRSNSIKKSKSTKKGKHSPPGIDRRVPYGTFSSAAAKRVVKVEELEKMSGCLFAVISPPPSSLPLPRFCLRPAKLNCNVEAAGADDGTAVADDLRRLLRLH